MRIRVYIQMRSLSYRIASVTCARVYEERKTTQRERERDEKTYPKRTYKYYIEIRPRHTHII